MNMRASVWFDEATLECEVAKAPTRERAHNRESSGRPARRTPTVQLERGSVFSKPLENGERLLVTVTMGHAWITMEGDAQDYVLTANEEQAFAGPGMLVIEGLQQGARVHLAPVR